VFLSYAREDRAIAAVIAHALITQGWTVWWDRKISPGLPFDEIIERELADCRCAIVLWSPNSIASSWVKNEATEALERRKLVPALIEAVKVPIGFRHLHAADLSGWSGDPKNAEWREILQRVAELAPIDRRLAELGAESVSVHSTPTPTEQATRAEADADRRGATLSSSLESFAPKPWDAGSIQPRSDLSRDKEARAPTNVAKPNAAKDDDPAVLVSRPIDVVPSEHRDSHKKRLPRKKSAATTAGGVDAAPPHVDSPVNALDMRFENRLPPPDIARQIGFDLSVLSNETLPAATDVEVDLRAEDGNGVTVTHVGTQILKIALFVLILFGILFYLSSV
jgi:hypothetical protein